MILPVVFLCLAAVLPPSAGEEPESFHALSTSRPDQQKVIVDKHNALRRGVRPTASNMLKMVWNIPAAVNAQKWANRCTLNHSPPNLRKTNVQCGENILMSTDPFPWANVVQTWYDEEKNFEYGIGAKKEGAVIGHFTQVVWWDSKEIGCAVAYCPNQQYKYYYVCQYCPMGNLRSSMKTPYKKGKPCGDCPHACENGLCTKL